ncbi:hypothetical protein sync_2427 [Synechococcus sp. CC9311]|nr:hypothetical protein sync_2427 [Synechococcus sp. CC9311]
MLTLGCRPQLMLLGASLSLQPRNLDHQKLLQRGYPLQPPVKDPVGLYGHPRAEGQERQPISCNGCKRLRRNLLEVGASLLFTNSNTISSA